MAAMVNMSNLINGKDSRWLQLEVCREFQRNKCSRPDTECKFAHPSANVEIQNGRVTACYDSIKVSSLDANTLGEEKSIRDIPSRLLSHHLCDALSLALNASHCVCLHSALHNVT